MIDLQRCPGVPLYQALYQQLRQEIQSGSLVCGDRLPSRRKLAEQLGISVNTVDSAYSQLEAEGFIQSFPRRGYFVQATGVLPPRNLPRESMPLPEKDHREEYLVDFSPTGMARGQFPFGVWRRLMKNCFNEYDEGLLLRTPPQGDLGLRRAVAEYLYRARGVRCDPEQIVMGAGTDNLLYILGYILPESYTLAVENPLYNRTDKMFSRLGHPVMHIPVDAEGIRLSALPEKEHVLVYTTPSHQYPLGFSMPIGQRTELLRWSGAGEERYILEDDYDSEFRYQARPIPSLQSIDPLGRVIYLGTFSRSVAPALRISYMVLPETLLERYRESYGSYASAVSGFEQTVLGEFMTSGHFDTHVNRMRIYYRNRRQALVEALSPLKDKMEILGEPAGHHLTLRFFGGVEEKTLVEKAAQQKVRVYPVSPYFRDEVPDKYRSTVLLGFGGLNDEEIRLGAALLEQAWNQ